MNIDLNDALELLKYDTRLQSINMKSGKISETDLSSHLQGLNDLSGNSEPLELNDDDGGEEDYGEAPQEPVEQPAQTQDSFGSYQQPAPSNPWEQE